jgi:anti-sigma factor RsiW
MSPRIPDTHAEAWALLPWLANGRIQASDREWVEAHVAGCEECRAEVAAQRMMATAMNRGATPETAATDEQRSFNRLWSRIEASESASPVSVAADAARPTMRYSRTVRWLAAAVVIQGFGLALFGFNALRDPSGIAEIETATKPAPTSRPNAPAVRIVFAPDASIATINTLLTHQGLSIVSGPGTAGNFTAELSADAVASGASASSVADVIAKDPNVSFAQPVAR